MRAGNYITPENSTDLDLLQSTIPRIHTVSLSVAVESKDQIIQISKSIFWFSKIIICIGIWTVRSHSTATYMPTVRIAKCSKSKSKFQRENEAEHVLVLVLFHYYV